MPLVLWLRTKRLQYGEWLYWRRAAIKARRKSGTERRQQKPSGESAGVKLEAKQPPR